MKFIRVRGRIVPIKEQNEKVGREAREKANKARAVAGAGIAGIGIGSREAGHQMAKNVFKKGMRDPVAILKASNVTRNFKFSAGAFAVAAGALVVAGIQTGKAIKAEKRAGKTLGVGGTLKEMGKGLGAVAAGYFGTKLAYHGLIKGGEALRPFTKKYAEAAVSLKKTKPRKNDGRALAGLLGYKK